MTSSKGCLLIKLILIGDSGVGKTAISARLVKDQFAETGTTTIGIAVENVERTTKSGRVQVRLWDTAGQERFKSVAQSYFRLAMGAFLVFAINDESSYQSLDRWLTDLRAQAPPNAVIFLIGNKADLDPDRVVASADAQAFADRNGLVYFESSARSAENVEEAFVRLIETVQDKVAKGELPMEKTEETETTTDPEPDPCRC